MSRKPVGQLIKTENGELYVKTAGKGEDLLLIHGIASDAEYFNDAVKILADSYRVITYDRPGYSRSKAGADKATVQAQTGQTIELLARLAPDGAYIAASSAGCLIAYELAVLHPDKVKGLLLFEPPLSRDPKILEAFSELKKVLRTMNEKKRVAKSLMMFINVSGGYDETAKSEPLSQQQQNFINYQYFLDKEMDSFLTYSNENIPDVGVPVSIAVGDMDSKGLFNRAGSSFADSMGKEPIRVHGYHNFPKDRPEEFAGLVKECFGKIDS